MTTTFKLLFLLFILSSCDKRYKVYPDRVKGNETIKDGFNLSEIAVTSFEKGGRPSEYSITQTVFCGPTSFFAGFYHDKVYNDTEKKIMFDAWKTMDSVAKINDNKIGGQGHEKGIDLYFSSERKRDSIEKLHFPFAAQKTIYFDKVNEYYKWVFCMKQGDFEDAFDYSRGVFDKMPIQFKIDQWYMFDFSNASSIIDRVFFYIDTKEKIHQHHYYKVIIGV